LLGADVSEEKTEPASEKKLENAREKGQVAHSRDLASAFAFIFALVGLVLTASNSVDHLRAILHNALTIARVSPELLPSALHAQSMAMAIDGLWIVAPVMLAAVLGGLVGGLSHVGMLFSFEPLAFNFDKLNPVKGVERIVSLRSLAEVGKMLVKAVVIGWVLYWLIRSVMPLLLRSGYGSFESIGSTAWDALLLLFGVCALLFTLLGVVDYVIQRLLHLRDQKMSKDEVEREYKEDEGDPQMKGERKAFGKELAFSDPKAAVAKASAVVVNPTHYAVALHYDPQLHGLPVVVAKGVDESAARIREAARLHGVPIIGNPTLARALYKVPLATAAPEELLEAVAIVLRWADQIRQSEAAC
jgi:type III secretion protein U